MRVKCFIAINQGCSKARTENWISNQYTVLNQDSKMFCIFVFNIMYLLGGLLKKTMVCFKCDSHQNQTFLSHSFLSIDTKSLRNKAWFCLESIYCLPSLTGTQLYVGSCEIHLADILNITQLYQYLNSNIFPVEQATIFHPLCEN